MQTFLPYSDFERSAASLDDLRLGKQRVETLQIMQSLFGKRIVTGHVVDTGKTRTIYTDPNTDERVFKKDFVPGMRYEAEVVPILKRVDLPRDEWFLEDAVGWPHHPAVTMWVGYEAALYEYQWACVVEWSWNRGKSDTCMDKTAALVDMCKPEVWHQRSHDRGYYPWWLGSHKLHRSHRSNLVRKVPEFYAPQFGNVPHDLPYHWPKEETGITYRESR